MSLNIEILSKAATQARGLCMDAVQASQSGHLGLPLGCAEMGAVLYGYALKYNPDEPRWINRDIFVLSGGHGSMFLYAWLHMSGLADVGNQTVPATAFQNAGPPRVWRYARSGMHHGTARPGRWQRGWNFRGDENGGGAFQHR